MFYCRNHSAQNEGDPKSDLSNIHLGMTQKLNMKATDPLPFRIEFLREYLEDHLGFDKFFKLYQRCQNPSEADDDSDLADPESSQVIYLFI